MKSRASYMQWGLWVAQILLVGLTAYFLIRAVIGFTNPESNWRPVESSPAAAAPVNLAVTANIDYGYDPFHRTSSIVIDIPQDLGSDAPETNLDLKMVGRTVPLSAILETPDGQQKSYQIDEEILNGVKLESVHEDYVVISQNGRLERLTFGEGKSTGLKLSAETQSRIGNLDARALLRSVSFTPAMTDDGTPRGLKIASLNRDINLEDFGLRSGDILTHIGSTDLRSGPPNISNLQRELSTGSSTKIKLIRDGQTLTVDLKL